MTPEEKLAQARKQLRDLLIPARDICAKAQAEGRDLTADEYNEVTRRQDQAKDIKASIEKAKDAAAVQDAIKDFADSIGMQPVGGQSSPWAKDAAAALSKAFTADGTGHRKAIVSGSIDTPSMVETNVVTNPHNPARLLSLLVNRQTVPGNEFEYFVQSARTNAAAPVADGALKPTSTFTVEPRTGRVRVVAHLTEPIPQRLLADHASLEPWLHSELMEGVTDALEAQVVTGTGVGENFTGILNTSGVVSVPFATDRLTTIRKARTAMENLFEKPNAWVLHPNDLEAIDLLREGVDGGFLAAAPGVLDNIWGGIRRVTSTSVPAGTALLADWNQAKLYIREGTRIDIDVSGEHFQKNTAQLRGEGRFGFAVTRPRAFAQIDLVGP